MIKVMIADDQELIRESLKVVLDMNPDMEVIGLAENGRQLLEMLAGKCPDVILMDVRMPELDGVLCTKAVKEKYPKVKIIILTTFDDDEYVYNALKYGASGYLLKGVSVPELSTAIRTVLSGGSMLNPGVVTKVVRLFNQMAQSNLAVEADETGSEELTRTERNIARLVGQGLSNKEIAERLKFSEGTVRNNLSAALSKLNLRDRTQMAIWAVQTGLAVTSLEEG
ncbi:MAG: response regulator transcription factor [Selenomonadaceae bacterium]|nr:response regulator transcription factor [Selenomonadaceae bacterium]MBQ1509997.1 response regulator transcription factor [Selenomonadaceae bacterium]MBQ1914857.1 response regulator transcription factor [Selenomonadaceae bacterium]MBQ3972106.1 response regulator transcription factor [Selenomonadaceae bacterium]